MASELQRVASGLVECLDEVPQVIEALHRTDSRCRHSAAAIAQLSAGDLHGRRIALLLDRAARDCEDAAKRCADAREAGRAWAAEKVGGGGSRSGEAAARVRAYKPAAEPVVPTPPTGEELAEESSDDVSRLAQLRRGVYQYGDDLTDAAEKTGDFFVRIFGPPPPVHAETRSIPAVKEQPRESVDAGHAASAVLVAVILIVELARWMNDRITRRKGDRECQ